MSEGDNHLQLIGHESVLRFFEQSITLGRLCSTYLLSGSAGIGKRVCARAIGQLILCKDRVGESACGQCSSCQAFQRQENPYFTERYFNQEKKSNESAVDVVRTFIDEIDSLSQVLHPVIVLIPNFQDYSIQVQNALLKTMEEPPSNIHIFLTSDRPHLVLETILSRCQHIRMSPLRNDELESILKKLELPTSTLSSILHLCEGRVDMALKLSSPEYIEMKDFIEGIIQKPPVDFLQVADKARSLTDQLKLGTKSEVKERDRVMEFVYVFEKIFIGRMINKVRDHFVAMQVLNACIEDIISARKALETSGHIFLSLDHYLNIATTRLMQMNKFSKTPEVS
ncbi:MAG: AAA family ATPase [Planctomycetes bacterium]|nr:AAA family ATPase [Planctomycetota bacterium]